MTFKFSLIYWKNDSLILEKVSVFFAYGRNVSFVLRVFLGDLTFVTEKQKNALVLGKMDQLRLDKMGSLKKRDEYLAVRFLSDLFLKQYYGVSINRLVKNHYGKPSIEGEDLSISISHSQNRMALAVIKSDIKLGIDLETKFPSKPLGLAKRYFSVLEYDYIRSISSEERRCLAARQIWSIKEAYYKALADSGSLEKIKALSIDLNKKTFQQESEDIHADFYTLYDEDYSLSLCTIPKLDTAISMEMIRINKNLEWERLSSSFIRLQ